VPQPIEIKDAKLTIKIFFILVLIKQALSITKLTTRAD